MAQLPSDEYLKSEEFRKADEEYRRKIRQEKYGPPKATAVKSTKEVVLRGSEAEIFREINSLRASPQTYANLLEERKSRYDGLEFKNDIAENIQDLLPLKCTCIHHLSRLSDTEVLLTNEGVTAVNDTIATLRKVTTLPAFEASYGLTAAAQDAVQEAGPKGAEQTDALHRTPKYGRLGSHVATELVNFGECSAREFVLRVLIDDGDPARQQRRAILDPQYKVLGLAVGDHNSDMKKVVCLILASGFTDH